MVLASQYTGLFPEFRYLSVNWLTRLNVSERALLHPFCICMIDISRIMGRVTCERLTISMRLYNFTGSLSLLAKIKFFKPGMNSVIFWYALEYSV